MFCVFSDHLYPRVKNPLYSECTLRYSGSSLFWPCTVYFDFLKCIMGVHSENLQRIRQLFKVSSYSERPFMVQCNLNRFYMHFDLLESLSSTQRSYRMYSNYSGGVWIVLLNWGHILAPIISVVCISRNMLSRGGVWRGFSSFGPLFFAKNKDLRARKRSPDALNIFPDTYDLPLHPPKRLGRYATIFTDWCNGLVSCKMSCRYLKMAPSKTPFLAIPDPKKSNLPHI